LYGLWREYGDNPTDRRGEIRLFFTGYPALFRVARLMVAFASGAVRSHDLFTADFPRANVLRYENIPSKIVH
jgi:hypothetical protein